VQILSNFEDKIKLNNLEKEIIKFLISKSSPDIKTRRKVIFMLIL
jgi:hypothetical protein